MKRGAAKPGEPFKPWTDADRAEYQRFLKRQRTRTCLLQDDPDEDDEQIAERIAAARRERLDR